MNNQFTMLNDSFVSSPCAPTATSMTSNHPCPSTHEQEQDTQTYVYVLIPVAVIVVILISSVLVILFKRKRRIDQYRHHLMPLYNFDESDDQEWDVELLDEMIDGRKIRVVMLPEGCHFHAALGNLNFLS